MRRTRVRLTAAYAVLFTLLATAAAAAFWLVLRGEEYRNIDSILRIDAGDVASNVQDAGSGANPLVLEGAISGYPVDISVLTIAGRALVSLGSGLAPADARRLAVAHGRTSTGWTGEVRSRSVDQRVLMIPVPGAPGVLVLVAHPLTEMEHELELTAIMLMALVAGLVVLTSALGYWLAGRALRPVSMISGLARDLSERDLHRRIDLPLPPDELGELADTFNNLLTRLQKAFLALRNFTADAAHELRAPLTLMRAELESALSGDGPVDRGVLSALVAETDRLSRLADQLLLLAQADAGRLAPERGVVDVADLLVEHGERWRPLAAAKEVRLVVQAPDSGTFLGDAGLLDRLVDNLLDNAIRHTPAGGETELSAQRTGAGWEVHVTDTGPGVPPDFRPRLFERFSRPGEVRSRQSGGGGLGLALCAAIAAAHGGSISLEDEARRGAHFIVRLPVN